MPTALLAAFAGLAALAPRQEAQAPVLATEGLDGRAGVLAPSDLPLEDPRKRDVWVIRPQGFAPLAAGEEDGVELALVLVNGDELTGRLRDAQAEELSIELAGGVVVPVALERVRRLVVPANLPEEQRHALVPADEGDRLYRVAGAMEPVDGTLEGFASEGVRFDSVLGARTIPWSEVGALFLELLAAPEAQSGGSERVPVVISLAGPAGGRLRGELVRLEAQRCRVVVGSDRELALPLGAVAEIVVADGRLAYLSDLEPSGETGRGAAFGDELGMLWPHRMDENALGGELRAGERAWPRGIGMHAPSRLAFALEPGWRTLRGHVAIDDGTRLHPPAARGSVIFRVLGDGEVLWESPVVRGGEPPLAIPPLALGDTRELVLEADPAGDFAGDRANWLGVVLVR